MTEPFASEYERGFIDGMQKQMQSSVDKAVNRMAQPEQEPEAWMYQEYRDDDQFGWRDEIQFVQPPNDPNYFRNIVPVYTTPPQRTWVGLTGEEAMDVTRKEGHELLDFIYEYGTGSEGVEERIVAICKAIEAKLKEKNT